MKPKKKPRDIPAKADFLKALAKPLATLDAAAAFAGVSREDVSTWQSEDEAFRVACARTRYAATYEVLRRARVTALEYGDAATLRWLTDRLDPDVRRAAQGAESLDQHDTKPAVPPTILIRPA